MIWYYADGANRVGPIEEKVLDELIASGKVGRETLVWREGMPSWQPLRVVRDATMGPDQKVHYAGFWIRFAARLIDGVVLAIVNAIVKIPLTIMLGIGSLAVKRYFAQWVSALILMIGYFMAAIDEQKRALHDRICDTRVVHSR